MMKYFVLLTILLITFDNCKSALDVNTLYLARFALTYNDALQVCKYRGMKLVRVDSAEDNTALLELAGKVPVSAFWIDGNDHNAEGVFVDANGKPLTYKNFGNNEPNGGRSENCISIYRANNGAWIDISCTARFYAFCHKDPNQVTTDQMEIEGSMFIASKSKLTFAESQEYCVSRGLRMVRINHALDNAVVHSYVRETKSDNYWIDANDIVTEGKWVDSDGNELLHKNFHPSEPNGNRFENCGIASLNSEGLWYDIRCDSKAWAFCYSDTDRGVLTDPNVLTMSFLTSNWMEARDYCKAQGLKLVKANNAGENSVIHGFSNRVYAEFYWLDGNDYKTEGRWTDSEENDLKHKGFSVGEPNGGRKENCLHGYRFQDGLWNDVPCDLNNLWAICAKSSLNLKYSDDYELDVDNLMLSTEKFTYNEALQFCRTRGTQLARVNSAADNLLLAAFAKKVVAEQYWIDGNDHTEEGKWVDSNGKEMPYKNWAATEPNGNRFENCIISNHLEEGTWRDFPCTNKYLAICSADPNAGGKTADFHYTRSKMAYAAAVQYCKSMGLKVFRVRNENSNTLIANTAKMLKLESFWLDGNDNAEEGKWVDDSGSELKYKNFMTGEPSGGRERNCLQSFTTGLWIDSKCEGLNSVVCFGSVKRVLKF